MYIVHLKKQLKNKIYLISVSLYIWQVVFVSLAYSQVSITSPGVSNGRLASPSDYATEVLNNPWDMDSQGDLAEFIPSADYGSGLINFSFQSGLFSFAISGADNAYFHLLSPGQCSTNPSGKTGQIYPIDTSKYRYLVLRMSTDAASEMRIQWYTGCSYITDWSRTTAIATKTGWYTYVIDLNSVTVETTSGSSGAWTASQATGLRIEPGYSGNVSIEWVLLSAGEPSSNGSHTVNYSFTPTSSNTRHSMFLDENSDPFDGYILSLVTAQTSASTLSVPSTYLFPDSYKVLGFASSDFATLRNNPWDMNDVSDIGLNGGIGSLAFSGGKMTGVTTNGDPTVFLSSLGTTIDASIFRYLSLGLELSQAGLSAVHWFDSSGNVLGQYYFGSSAGSNVYQVDLGGVAGWSGQISSLRLLIQTQAGTTFSVDFASLSEVGFVSSLTSPTIQESPGALNVNFPPLASILQPDSRGGRDFASTVLGNPWNFEGTDDIQSVTNVSEASILPNNYVDELQGNFFYGLSVDGSDDPYQVSHTVGAASTSKIDTSIYKNLVFRALIERDQDVTNGSVSRIIWESDNDGDFYNGDDIIMFDGWNEYVFDMTSIILEPGAHAPGTYIEPPWHGSVNYLRVDAHEFSTATPYYFDYIYLTADDESNSMFTLAYEASDSDDSSSATVSFFYNTQKSTSGGTLIVADLPLSRDSRVYEWDTSALAEGTYYIYAVASDGYNSVPRLATGRLVINHTTAQNAQGPTLVVDAPIASQTIYDASVVRGYAIDDIEVALVEVYVDGDLFSSFVPSRFNKTAQAQHPSLSRAGNAGFYKVVTFSSLSVGTHSLEVKAYDTAGNEASSGVLIVTKAAGSDPALDTEPDAENESAIEIPVATGAGIKFTVRPNYAKAQIAVVVSKSAECDVVDIVAGTSKSDLQATHTNIKEFVGTNAKKTFVAKKLKSSKKKGKVYLGVLCNGNLAKKKVKAVIPSRVTSRKSVKTLDQWIAGVRLTASK